MTSLGKALDTSERRFGFLRSSADATGNPEQLRQRMEQDGYLLLPQLLLRHEGQDARAAVLDELAKEDLLEKAFPIDQAEAKPNTQAYFRPDLARDNRALQRVLYREGGPMMKFFTAFLGGPVCHFDFTWLRCVAPGAGTPSHTDIVYMGRGTKRLFTAWTPLSDISLSLGGLMILEGSHLNDRLLNGLP